MNPPRTCSKCGATIEKGEASVDTRTRAETVLCPRCAKKYKYKRSD